jgi:hypothetical protein
MATTPKYDLYSDRFRAQTYDTFAQMRAEDPVFCQPGIDGETMICSTGTAPITAASAGS